VSRTGHHSQVYRHDAAWLCVVLWLLTFLLVPGLHLLGHDNNPHHHLLDGGTVFLGLLAEEAAEHAHADGTRHVHAEPAENQDGSSDPGPEDPQDGLPDQHGSTSSGHLKALLLANVQIPLVITQQPSNARPPVAPVSRLVQPAPFLPSLPRGPPIVTSEL